MLTPMGSVDPNGFAGVQVVAVEAGISEGGVDHRQGAALSVAGLGIPGAAALRLGRAHE